MPTQVDYNNLLLIQRACHFGCVGYGVGWFERWNNAFGLAEKLESFQRLPIIHCHVGGTPSTLVVTMFRSYSRIIQPGGNALSPQNLPGIVLEDIGFRPMQNPHRTGD